MPDRLFIGHNASFLRPCVAKYPPIGGIWGQGYPLQAASMYIGAMLAQIRDAVRPELPARHGRAAYGSGMVIGSLAGMGFERKREGPGLNSPPFVRQYGILNNKWGVLLCRKEYQTNAIHQNSRSRL